ncbi:metallophosphoesterase [Alteromonadaceae bacterium M269]|nr:metallophosphoesterase [Alteromonadaceae bacterium M269]
MSFRVVQITDCHLFADKNKIVGDGISSYNTLDVTLKAVGKMAPDLVIVTGDLSADESAESYQHFQNLWSQNEMSAELKVIPGNHDAPDLMKAAFKGGFWREEPIQVKGWMLHSLHSQVAGIGKGNVSVEQLRQLQMQLDTHSRLSHFIAVHHHPIPMNSWMDNYEWMNREAFIDFVKLNNNIKLIIHGHVHTTRELVVGEAQLLSAPSTCWQFKHEAEFAFEQGAPAFRVINLHQDGSYESDIIEVM